MYDGGSSSSSAQARLNRLLGEDGRCFDVAIDHGFFNEPSFLKGIEDMPAVVKAIVQANPDAVQLSVGQASLLQSIPGKNKPALVLRTDVTNIYGSPPPTYLFSELIDEPVLTAVRLDAACVVVNLLKVLAPLLLCPRTEIEGKPELHHQCVKNITKLKAECERYGMPLMVEPLCMTLSESYKYGVNGDVNQIMPLVRQAVELGADIIKADPTTDPSEYWRVIQVAAGKPVLVRGGAMTSEKEIFERTEALLKQGARGIVYGRNIIQHSKPRKITEAFMAMVHKDASVSESLAMLED